MNMVLKLLLILLVLLSATFHSPPSALATTPDAQARASIYWGAWAGGEQYRKDDAPFDLTTLDAFEVRAGKRVSILRWGQPWYYQGVAQKFPAGVFDSLRERGVIPLLDWGSWNRADGVSLTNQPAFRTAVITQGRYDNYIRQWAKDAKRWGYPFFLRFDMEMNGWWFPWSEGKDSNGNTVNGNRRGDFIKMWRHVHDIFTEEQATNVTWVWSVNIQTRVLATNGQYGDYRYPYLSQLYPGDRYVDWTGITLYNVVNGNNHSFDALLTGNGNSHIRNTYADIGSIASNKPMMLAEFGTSEQAGNANYKAHWIKDALMVQIPYNFPQIKAVVYYNVVDAFNSYIETSRQAQAGFAQAISLPQYATDTFGYLPKGVKIRPLR